MASSRDTVEEYVSFLGNLNTRYKSMFGEYCIYVDEKPVAFVCDDTLFLKPVGLDDPQLNALPTGEAYPGSKLYHIVSLDEMLDTDWFQAVAQATADAQPAKKPRKKKR